MAIVAKFGTGLWVTAWAVRQRLEADKPLDNRTKLTRIALILGCWTVAAIPMSPGLVSGVARGLFALVGCAYLWWPNLALRVSTRIWSADFGHVYGVLQRWDPLGLADAEASQVAYQPFVAEILDSLEKGEDVPTLAGILGRFRSEWSRDSDQQGDYRVAEGLMHWWQSKRLRRAAA
jgi:hypothetical protein